MRSIRQLFTRPGTTTVTTKAGSSPACTDQEKFDQLRPELPLVAITQDTLAEIKAALAVAGGLAIDDPARRAGMADVDFDVALREKFAYRAVVLLVHDILATSPAADLVAYRETASELFFALPKFGRLALLDRLREDNPVQWRFWNQFIYDNRPFRTAA